MSYGTRLARWSNVIPNDRMPEYNSLKDPHLKQLHGGARVKQHIKKMQVLEGEARVDKEKQAKLAQRRNLHCMYGGVRSARRRNRSSSPAGSRRTHRSGSTPPSPDAAPNRGAARPTPGSSPSPSSSSSTRTAFSSSSSSAARSAPTPHPPPAAPAAPDPGDAGLDAAAAEAEADAETLRPAAPPSAPASEAQSPSSASTSGRSSGGCGDSDGGSDAYSEGEGEGGVAPPSGEHPAGDGGVAAGEGGGVAEWRVAPPEVVARVTVALREMLVPQYGAKGLGKPARIAEWLFLSDGKAARNAQALQSLGVTLVINCAPSQCRTSAETYSDTGIRYMEVHALDDSDYPLLPNHLPEVLTAVQEVKAGGGSTLIHCFQGVNRSATLVVACLMEVLQMPLAEGVAVVQAARPVVLQGNDGFLAQLVHHACRVSLLGEL